eukprot:SAG31_NODE_550_length_14214_cov_3.054269_2_plen_47_part_00
MVVSESTNLAFLVPTRYYYFLLDFNTAFFTLFRLFCLVGENVHISG